MKAKKVLPKIISVAMALSFGVLASGCALRDTLNQLQCEHNFEDSAKKIIKLATCYEEGKELWTCTRCGREKEVVTQKAHIERELPRVSPTCTSEGLSIGKECSVCGLVLIAQEVLPMTEHTAIKIAGTPSTCLEKGLSDGEKCGVCDLILTVQTEVPIGGHSYGADGYCIYCHKEEDDVWTKFY